ncbi:MAG TPA: bifunctional demethylmenaquinone methyltransferase/2-methoxy-6-polyprenyl-1,4-benzoquinol methylase, partial [Thalassospira sp.]|nr:bifunctional demethylmenaquinone methyltransferase/2-methoxy-6-polyprenyl-1,4-benzoquinol methylase [Thalassospira sp.]
MFATISPPVYTLRYRSAKPITGLSAKQKRREMTDNAQTTHFG